MNHKIAVIIPSTMNAQEAAPTEIEPAERSEAVRQQDGQSALMRRSLPPSNSIASSSVVTRM